MREIPEDVKIAAVDAVLAGCGILPEVEVIADAILAERRRCAEIARRHVIHGHAYATANGMTIVKEIEAGA